MASAREDLARAYYDNDPAALNGSFIGLGKTIAAEAQWFANESESEELKAAFQKAGSEALEQVASNKNASRYANDIAIVTGVSPNSIAAQVVEGLLAGGATVVATSHSFKPSIKAWAKQPTASTLPATPSCGWFRPTSPATATSTHWSTGWATSRRRPPVLPPRF